MVTSSNSGELFGLDMTFSRPPMGVQLASGLVRAINDLRVGSPGWEMPEALTAAGEQFAITEDDGAQTLDISGAKTLVSLLVTKRNVRLTSRSPEPEPDLIEVAGVPVPYFAMGSLVETILVRPYYDPQRFPGQPRPDGEYGAINAQLHYVHGALFRSMKRYGYGPK